MIFAVSVTMVSVPLFVASAAGLGSVATSLVRSHRNIQRVEQEFEIYDRAFEIYSRLPPTANAGSQLVISEELILLAARKACGGLTEKEYRKAKARVTSPTTVFGTAEPAGSLGAGLAAEGITSNFGARTAAVGPLDGGRDTVDDPTGVL